MKKLIAMLFVMALCVPVFAEDRHTINSVTYDGTLTVAYSTASTSACELAYVLIETTGPVASRTVTIRNSTTNMFVIEIPASGTTDREINLSEFPVRVGTNLNYGINVVDASIRLTLVYRKLN